MEGALQAGGVDIEKPFSGFHKIFGRFLLKKRGVYPKGAHHIFNWGTYVFSLNPEKGKRPKGKNVATFFGGNSIFSTGRGGKKNFSFALR